MKKWLILLLGTSLILAIAAVSCGGGTTPESPSTVEPRPTVPRTPSDDGPTGQSTPETRSTVEPRPTAPGTPPEDIAPRSTQKLTHECAITEIASVGPIDALRGRDPVPTGFDPINTAFCSFTKPIASVSPELLHDQAAVFGQEVTLDPPSEEVRFPLSKELVEVVPADIEPGLYNRRIQVNISDGDTIEVISDVIWVFDPDRHPVTKARNALSEMEGVAADVTFLLIYEPVVWEDASLGCPEPGKVYAEVETPGFKLLLSVSTPELQDQRYEYHTNLAGSVVVLCDERDEHPVVAGSPIEFVMKDNYPLGQNIEIKIRNNGTKGYVYSEYYPACINLEFYDESEEGHKLERSSGPPGEEPEVVELPPGLFVIPEEPVSEVKRRPKPPSVDSRFRGNNEILSCITHQCIVLKSEIVMTVLA